MTPPAGVLPLIVHVYELGSGPLSSFQYVHNVRLPSLVVLAIKFHPDGTPFTTASLPLWMATIASNTSPADADGLLTVSTVVTTSVDDAYEYAPALMAAIATEPRPI